MAGGSTAGHLGLAWGWYMVSPNFGYLWSNTASQPAPYTASNLIKAVVLMTDGDFNTDYCNGVISQDTNVYGTSNSYDHINCDAPNGLSNAQAANVCTAIKNAGVTLYTVGFDLAGDTAAQTRLTDCATSPADFFNAPTGADLTAAFQVIAQKLNSLRLSQ